MPKQLISIPKMLRDRNTLEICFYFAEFLPESQMHTAESESNTLQVSGGNNQVNTFLLVNTLVNHG